METENLSYLMSIRRFYNEVEIINLLRNGADPNIVTYGLEENFPMGMCNDLDDSNIAENPARWAAVNTILRSFLEHPRFNINYVSPITEECILTRACLKYHPDIMRIVLDDQRLVVRPDIIFTCMYRAIVYRGNALEKLQVLMRSNKIRPTYWERIKLCFLISNHDFSEAGYTVQDIQNQLLENITDFNIQRPEDGNTALHEVGGNIEACRLLLARGANPLIRNARGETALDTANRRGGDWPRGQAIIKVLANAIKPHLRTVMMSARRSVGPNCASIIGRYAAEGYGFHLP